MVRVEVRYYSRLSGLYKTTQLEFGTFDRAFDCCQEHNATSVFDTDYFSVAIIL